MEPPEFAAVKQRVMGESSPSDGHDLDGMSMDFDGYLWHSRLITEVAVRLTGDTDNLIMATCWIAPGCSTVEIAAELERIWLQDLRYQYFEAHMITSGERGVRLDVVTQIAPDDFYVTAAVVVETARPATGGATG
ncbi:hypothetical protein [Streptosporangium roseum]|uniref:hypothetical protein n=1 Tax=Streptosporangium roseum TaxID=2001 RepID=UPI0011D18078|nr:hypothetical protein [Streptosporangium roseum]